MLVFSGHSMILGRGIKFSFTYFSSPAGPGIKRWLGVTVGRLSSSEYQFHHRVERSSSVIPITLSVYIIWMPPGETGVPVLRVIWLKAWVKSGVEYMHRELSIDLLCRLSHFHFLRASAVPERLKGLCLTLAQTVFISSILAPLNYDIPVPIAESEPREFFQF
jgi:hypothetical protein